MSDKVKLSSRLVADDQTNGLDSFAPRLLDRPDDFLVAVVWLDTQKVTIDTDTGDHVPTVRIRRIEPLGDLEDVSDGVRTAVERAVEKRTGRKAIPFGVVEVDEGYDPAQLSLVGDDE